MKNLFFLTICMASIVQVGNSQKPSFTNDDKVALNGYDVVAYHNAHSAVRGSNEHTAIVEGTTYYFSNVANQKAFKENHGNYLPQFGGFCAFAMAMQGKTVPSDPNTFKIRDGKLYMFYNDFYQGKPFNTIVPWNGAEQEMLQKATANWSKTK